MSGQFPYERTGTASLMTKCLSSKTTKNSLEGQKADIVWVKHFLHQHLVAAFLGKTLFCVFQFLVLGE